MFYLDEFDHGTAENDFGSDGPGSVWSEPAGLAKELLFEPRRLSACEVESVLGRAAAGNGHTRGAIGAEPQNVAPGTRMLRQKQGNTLAGDVE
jgi:hypothetical protein